MRSRPGNVIYRNWRAPSGNYTACSLIWLCWSPIRYVAHQALVALMLVSGRDDRQYRTQRFESSRIRRRCRGTSEQGQRIQRGCRKGKRTHPLLLEHRWPVVEKMSRGDHPGRCRCGAHRRLRGLRLHPEEALGRQMRSLSRMRVCSTRTTKY